MNKNKNKKMSYWGVGPVYVTLSLIITIIGWILGGTPVFKSGVNDKIKIFMYVLGIVLILHGIYLWINGVIISKIDKNIDENNLVTTGIYAYVRNPIYAAFMILFTGIILLRNNLFLLIIPFILWGFMSIIVRKEERVLESIFGDKYLEYKKKVNRCIPWIPANVDDMKFKQRSIKTFNKRSKNYDETVEGKMAAWSKNLLLSCIELNENDKLIDIACGTGKLLSLIENKKKIKGYGIDISEGMINAASNKNPNMEFKVADCIRIPYKDNFFDIATVSVAYHHFTKTAEFAREVSRILRSNGRLYIVEIRLPFFMRKIFNLACEFIPTGDIKAYTQKEIIDNFNKNGFKVVKIKKNGFLQLLCFEAI